MVGISAIGRANPKNQLNQADIQTCLQSKVSNQRNKRYLDSVFTNSGIKSRYSVLNLKDDDIFYGKNLFSLSSTTAARQRIFDIEIENLTISSIIDLCRITRDGLNDITDIITVSCTGFKNPGFDVSALRYFNLPGNINRYHLGFMGCYAALPAIELAFNICKSRKGAKVLVICAEICSIHIKTSSTDDILGASLFADGAAALKIEQGGQLQIVDYATQTILTEDKDLAWKVGDLGYDLLLSSYVSKILATNFHIPFTDGFESVNTALIIHPGGKSIIDRIAEKLNLHDLPESRLIFSEYGNMSSPTILFCLDQYLATNNPTKKNIILAAFGPGLTAKYLKLYNRK